MALLSHTHDAIQLSLSLSLFHGPTHTQTHTHQCCAVEGRPAKRGPTKHTHNSKWVSPFGASSSTYASPPPFFSTNQRRGPLRGRPKRGRGAGTQSSGERNAPSPPRAREVEGRCCKDAGRRAGVLSLSLSPPPPPSSSTHTHIHIHKDGVLSLFHSTPTHGAGVAGKGARWRD